MQEEERQIIESGRESTDWPSNMKILDDYIKYPSSSMGEYPS